MAKNFIQPGEVIEYTAGAAITSGQGVAIGVLLGVALDDVANGAVGRAKLTGVFELPKLSAAVITAGASLIWDTTNKRFKIASPATGDLNNAAVAIEAAGNGVTTVKALLTPGHATVQA